MLENEIKNIWKLSGNDFQIHLERITSAYLLEKKLNKFDTILFWRNLREYFASISVIVIFGYYMFFLPMSITTKVGCSLIIIASVFHSYKIWKIRKEKIKIKSDFTLLAELKAIKEYLNLETILLKNVFWWSLLPSIPGLVLFHIGTIGFAQLLSLKSIIVIIFYFIILTSIWFVNQMAVKKKFIPLLLELDNQIKSFDEL